MSTKVRRKDLGLITRIVHEVDNVSTGILMRAARENGGLSLREMARRLNYSAPFISDLELGRRNWTQEMVDKWASVLCGSETKQKP